VIRSGGLGQLIDAMDASLGRRVTLKVSWEDDSRLRLETRAMAPFRHASLPTIHSMGHDGDMDFVVLEHLYGITLADQLRLTRDTETLLPIDDVVRVLRATADALSVIHTAGLCHLDVRPDNIIVTADRRTVLVDCGLCVPELDLGRQAQEVATPAYMAPECRTALDQETARLADL
jgi:serine/threonine protein kinase